MIGGVHKWLIPCNWKFPAENFSGDRYHGVSHRSVDMVGIGPSGKGRRDMQERNEARWLDVSFPELGHSMIAFLRPHDSPLAPAYQDAPVVADYFRHCEEERKRRRGEYWRLFGGPGTVFPEHASPLARQPRTLAVWHPRGPHQTEVWRWYLVDADAPAEVKDFLRHYYIRYSGPSGLTEQDDMENWNYAHKASRGTIARQYPYNYEMGLGRGHARASRITACKLPGADQRRDAGAASENNQRGFYTRWRQFMEAGELEGPRPRERRVASLAAAPQGGDRGVPLPRGRAARRAAVRGVARRSSPRTRSYLMPMRRNVPHDEPEREFTRAGADVNWFDEGKDTLTRRVKQIQTGIHWAEEPPSRICHMVSNVQILRARRRSAAPPTRSTVQEPLSRLPQSRRDGDRHPGRQARGRAPPGGRRLEDRAPQDHPRPERPAREESDVFLLI